jgi:tRNA(fMet)-specific endonuclease VapC
MLDTNIISFLIRDRGGKLFEYFKEKYQSEQILLSSIVYAELIYGIKKKGSKRLENKVLKFLELFEIVSFSKREAIIYADIRNKLKISGKVIGANDMLIASHALSLNATLVTNNTKEFERIEKLKLEDWSLINI